MQELAGVRCVRLETRMMSAQLSAETVLRFSSTLCHFGVRNCWKEETNSQGDAQRFCNFDLFWRSAHVLRNVHDVGAAVDRVTAPSDAEIVRLQRSKL